MGNSGAKTMALSGVLAALAVVVMCLGGLIPVATYVCPVLCCVLCCVVFFTCGRKLAWVWYAAVSILSLLLGPDKEAAGVYLVLGYYPMLKPILERSRLSWLWKFLLFQGAIAALYMGLIHLLGIEQVVGKWDVFALLSVIVMLIMGNVVFFFLDRVLTMVERKFRRKG